MEGAKGEKQDEKNSPTHPPPTHTLQLAAEGDLKLGSVRHFVIDECDKVLDNVEMRADVQDVFKRTPHDKQVLMFSATLDANVRPICKKFMTDVRIFRVGCGGIGLGGRAGRGAAAAA